MRDLTKCGLALLGLAIPSIATAEPLAQATAGTVRQACKTDYRRLCDGTKPGGGRILACFKSHAADLSAECREALLSQRKSKP